MARNGRLFPVVFFLCGVLLVSCSTQPPCDTVLIGGKVITLDSGSRIAEALAVREGRIVAVGSNSQIEAYVGPATRRIDLGGRTLIPGMADNHFHSAGGGPGVDLSRVRTMEELLAAIQEKVETSKPGEVITTNSDWHEAQIAEQRLPLRRDLDAIAPENPIVVVRGGHEFILNSVALKKWNIDEKTPVPSGGRITRYADGSLNGELVDAAKRLVTLPEQPEKSLEQRIQDQMEEYRKAARAGLTSIRHPGAPVAQYRLLQEMKKRGDLKIRVNFVVRAWGVGSGEELSQAIDSWGLQPEEGDDWLRIGGVKLGTDGGFEGGWMREPYAEPWGQGGTFYGLQLQSQENFNELVRELGMRKWRVATHAVGDAAIDMVLAGYQAFHQEQPINGRRWTIEHAFIPRTDQFPLMRTMGLVVSAQNHLYLAGPSLDKYWGRERAEWVTPIRAYLDNQIKVSLGTDAPVVPYPPLWVIYHFVTRDTITGGVFGAGQAVTREEALRLITLENAYLNFEEAIKGSLEPGKLADLVVLSDDILTCTEQQIRDMEVLLTMVNGEVVYQDEGFPLLQGTSTNQGR